MAHFAELDSQNYVLRVVVIDNEEMTDPNGNESEELGRARCVELFGGEWVQTSYNATIRGKFAGIGDFYDEEGDVFR